MDIVEVATASPYRCFVGSGALTFLAEQVGDARRVAILFPDALPGLAAMVRKSLEGTGLRIGLLPVPAGEAAKTPEVLSRCWRALAAEAFTRSDLIIGIGGGATTDLAGFVAATWLRGIDFITVPTTVLAMVDAAIGGKTGIDLPEGKNLVGAFHEPRAVVADFDLLAGLPRPEIIAGMAEVIKAGFVQVDEIEELIRQDPGEATEVTSPRFARLVHLAVEFKARTVAADLTEYTSTADHIGRELLNYGHTMAHAIEARERFRIRHGEAVALGMVYAGLLAEEVLGLDAPVVRAQRGLLADLGLPTNYSAASFDELRLLMSRDKKSRGDQLRFVLLRQARQPTISVAPAEDALARAYRRLGE